MDYFDPYTIIASIKSEVYMEKSIFNRDYTLFLALLRRARKNAGLTQSQLASHLGLTQSIISKCERGERRIDIIELRAFCNGIGIPLEDFISQLEAVLQKREV